MTRVSRRLAFLVILAILPLHAAHAGDVKVSGLAYGDYYWLASSHDDATDNSHGLWFRRLDVTVDGDLNESFSTRVRLEADSPGDFLEKAKLEPFVKDLWLRWESGAHGVVFGLSPTPTWSVIEKTWGYRMVEKTPADLFNLGSSRDIGLAAQGSFGEGELVRYHAMVGNGNSTSSETDLGKRAMLSIGLYPTENLILEAYGDLTEWDDGPTRVTMQAFAAYVTDAMRFGLQFIRQSRYVAELDLEVASAFGVVRVTDSISILARYDRTLDPIPGASKISYVPFADDAQLNFVLLGLDLSPHESVKIVPNVEAVFYSDVPAGTSLDTDLVARLTVFWKF